MNKEECQKLAEETLQIIKAGKYTTGSGKEISISKEIEQAIKGSKLYKPSNIIRLSELAEKNQPIIEVTTESTLEAAKRLVIDEGIPDTVCLNFASAKNPGGGFLRGTQAQEESLARSSGLYACIAPKTEMYDFNRSRKTGIYSDYMIYSPKVPVFRNDYGVLLEEPYNVSFITSPSVNTGHVRRFERQNVNKIPVVMTERIQRILAVAAQNGEKAIVLGAFGCGVFKNNPADVAEYFRKLLVEENMQSLFKKIVFAIYDKNQVSSAVNIFKMKLIRTREK